jgi:uncharacterized Zn finger protein
VSDDHAFDLPAGISAAGDAQTAKTIANRRNQNPSAKRPSNTEGACAPDPWYRRLVQPFAHVLHRDAVQRLAGTAVFSRGEAYFREGRVAAHQLQKGELSADVRGTELYRARIWVKGEGLAYACPCPFAREDGAFCKHLVAMALSFLRERAGAESVAPDRHSALVLALERLPAVELVDLISKTARNDRAVLLAFEAALARTKT